MIRWIRDKLAEIEYHSATRRKTVWSRANNAALLVAFVLAGPAMWMADGLLARVHEHRVLQGHVLKVGNDYGARFYADSNWLFDYGPGIEVLGTFAMQTADERRGWPLLSSERRIPIEGTIDLYGNPKPLTGIRLDPADPMKAAILAELRANGPAELGDWLREPMAAGDMRWHPVAAIMSSAIWLVMLIVVLRMGVLAARLVAFYASGTRATRRVRRLREGLCHKCGYNLRGLDFHARCPECGAAVAI